MDYEQAIAYLDSFVNYERTHQPHAMREVKLARMQRLCQRLSDPQRRFRSVLVTGTNGKGSICAMLYSMLRESPLRAGLFTSPHLEQLRERIRAWTDGPGPKERTHGDDWIREEEFAAIMEQLRPVLDELCGESPEGPPTYFEVLTAVAFRYFLQRQVDIAVLEVGMGGRLDATNVVEQAVSVIAPIGVDHADVLGADPVSIAREKAGIFKPGQVVITALQEGGVADVLRAFASAVPFFPTISPASPASWIPYVHDRSPRPTSSIARPIVTKSDSIPPCSAGTRNPKTPSSPMRRQTSHGNSPLLSHARERGASSRVANARSVRASSSRGTSARSSSRSAASAIACAGGRGARSRRGR